MTSDAPEGWVSLTDAAKEMRIVSETLRRLVGAGEFTRLRKTPGSKAAIYVPRGEVDAFIAGGLDGLREHRGVVIGEAGA
jgi:hypothetical protein